MNKIHKDWFPNGGVILGNKASFLGQELKTSGDPNGPDLKMLVF